MTSLALPPSSSVTGLIVPVSKKGFSGKPGTRANSNIFRKVQKFEIEAFGEVHCNVISHLG
jgi:hypothetical protein